MDSIIEFLENNSAGFLATIENGAPRVRPFQFMLAEDKQFYFCTANSKSVYQQLQADPRFEFSCASPTYTWLRLRGEAVFVSDLSIKSRVLEKHPLVKSIYQEASNPEFEVFFVDKPQLSLSDFSGQPPKMLQN